MPFNLGTYLVLGAGTYRKEYNVPHGGQFLKIGNTVLHLQNIADPAPNTEAYGSPRPPSPRPPSLAVHRHPSSSPLGIFDGYIVPPAAPR
jgi:hypothetical protein